MDIFTARWTQRQLERIIKQNHTEIVRSFFVLNLQDISRSAYLIYWRLGTDEEDKLFLNGELSIEAPQFTISSIPIHLMLKCGHMLGCLIIEVD